MTISRTAQGTWRVRVDVGRDKDGKRKRKTGTFTTKREAQAAEHLWSELARTDVVVREAMRLEEFIYDVYLPSKQDKVRPSTLRSYKQTINKYIIPTLGMRAIGDINHAAVQKMIDTCTTRRPAEYAKTVLNQIMRLAQEMGYVQANICAQRYDLPKREVQPDQHNGTWLSTFAEHARFLDAIDNPLFRTMAELGLGLGLRKGEIFGLNWEDVDFTAGTVHVQRTYVADTVGYTLMDPKTYESNRFIPMHKRLYDYLLAQWEKQGKPRGGAVVVNYRGERANPRRATDRWPGYLESVGLPYVTILNLRHSFATACLNAGVDVTKVSKMLGHTDISITVKRYVRFKPQDFVSEFSTLVNNSYGTKMGQQLFEETKNSAI